MTLEPFGRPRRYESSPQFAYDLEAAAERLLEEDQIGLADHYQAVVWFARALHLIIGLCDEIVRVAPEEEASQAMSDACELLSLTVTAWVHPDASR